MRKTAWVIVLESSARLAGGDMDEHLLRRLLEGLGDLQPVGLHSPDRYAVQLQIQAQTHTDALVLAVAHWRTEVQRLIGGDPPLYRAEVMTLEEFEQDCRIAYEGRETPVDPSPAGERGDTLGNRLLWQAFNDPLTELPNRGLFMNQLELALLCGPGAGARHGLLAVKLLGLDKVNRQWGRSTGDEVLITAVQRLRSALPPEHVAARIGGDELATLFETPSIRDAQTIASAVVASLGEPVLIGDVEVSVIAGAGVAFGRRAQDAEELVAQARAARRASEFSGRAEVYRPGLAPAERTGALAPSGHDLFDYLLLLQRATMAANESSSPALAAGLVVTQVCAHLGWAVGHMYEVGSDGDLRPARLPRQSHSEYQPLFDVLDHTTLAAGEGLAGRVAQSAQPAWVLDIAATAPTSWSTTAISCGLQAAIAFPVLVGREVVAVLEFFAQGTRPPDDALVEVLRGVGSQLGRVVERRRSQDELRTSEARLREAEALAQLGSWHLDAVGGSGAWTEGMHQILGVPADAPHTVAYFMELVHPQDRPRVHAATERALTPGPSDPLQYRIIRPDGVLRWVCARTYSLADDAGNVVEVHGTIVDITAVKAAEETLREREQQLVLAEKVAGLGSWIRDLRTDHLEWSDGMFRLWGVDRSTFVPTVETVLLHIHPEHRDHVRRSVAYAARVKEAQITEFQATLPDGRQRWFRGRAAARYDEHGQPVRIVGTILDVTNEQLTEPALRAYEERYPDGPPDEPLN